MRGLATTLLALVVGLALVAMLGGVMNEFVDTFWVSRGPWRLAILGAGLLLTFLLLSMRPRRRRG